MDCNERSGSCNKCSDNSECIEKLALILRAIRETKRPVLVTAVAFAVLQEGILADEILGAIEGIEKVKLKTEVFSKRSIIGKDC